MEFLDNLRRSPDRAVAIASYAKLAPAYESTCGMLGRIRLEALAALELREGETVIDVACGTGAMFAALSRAVGRGGRVIGIEQSPDMAAIGRRRITEAGLDNVSLVVAPAEESEIAASADAVLFCYAHDVLQSDRAVERVLAATRPGARIVAAGARLVGWWAAPLNLWKLWRSRDYVSTYRGMCDPAAGLARRCPDWKLVSTHVFGTSYLAAGHYDARTPR